MNVDNELQEIQSEGSDRDEPPYPISKLMVEVLESLIEKKNQELLRKFRSLKPLLSIEEVADTFGVSKRTMEDIVNAGKLKPIWIKGQRRFHPDAVDAYLRSCIEG